MALFFITLLIVALVMAGMAIGVILRDKPIKGSCGGIGALGMDTACDICGGDPKRCEQETRAPAAKSELFYEAD